jgi:uncharacterized repeat protein (TIGR03803 family)
MSILSPSTTDEIVVKSSRRGRRASALKLLIGIAVAGSAASAPVAATASTFSVLYNFGSSHDGAEPIRGVIYRDGAFYGSVQQGGKYGFGMLYKFDPDTGTETPLYSFKGGAKGQYPGSDLHFMHHQLYGTSYTGGTANKGSIFRFKIGSSEAHLLYSFQGLSDGGNPTGVISVDGTLYGTCQGGGAGFGAVVKFDPATKQVSTVYQFTGGDDGATPDGGVISVNGLLFGTTNGRGAGNGGTVYSINPATGAETTIYAFNGAGDGVNPSAPLTYAKGLLYGTTNSGGTNGKGVVFSVDPTTGKEVVLHSFAGSPDGSWPIAQLTYLHGDLYGTASQGGSSSNLGTIFKVNAKTGEETTLRTFTGAADDGGASTSSLYLHKGKLYGTASIGGTHGAGVLFAFTP